MTVEQVVQKWIEQFIIKHNLCPFAKVPFQKDRIRYVVFEGKQLEQAGQIVHQELLLLGTTSTSFETSLLIFPNILEDFEDYLDFLAWANEVLTVLKLEGVLQLASFHPDYQFEGTQKMEAQNYTNRSPYPILHLLKEEQVEFAVKAFPNTQKIPEQNIQTMDKLGTAQLQQIWHSFFKD